ncbi:MAG: hypothetical protein NT099_02675 [Candidatus Saganbacteria bacterium]|nr:hypothetical protein [Candidatus Saganbacteria bacterium]
MARSAAPVPPAIRVIVTYRDSQEQRIHLSHKDRATRNASAPTTARNFAGEVIEHLPRPSRATGGAAPKEVKPKIVNIADVRALAHLAQKGLVSIEVVDANTAAAQDLVRAVFIALLTREFPEFVAAAGKIDGVKIRREGEVEPTEDPKVAANRQVQERLTALEPFTKKHIGSENLDAAKEALGAARALSRGKADKILFGQLRSAIDTVAARVQDAERHAVRAPRQEAPAPARKATPAQAAEPEAKFKWLTRHKVEAALTFVFGAATAAAAVAIALPEIIATAIPALATVTIHIAVPIVGGALTALILLINIVSVRAHKGNFKGVGILKINDTLYPPEQKAEILAAIKALGRGRGIYASYDSYRENWSVGYGDETAQIWSALKQPLSLKSKSPSYDIKVEKKDGGNEVVFIVKYETKPAGYTSTKWDAKWTLAEYATEELLRLRGLSW